MINIPELINKHKTETVALLLFLAGIGSTVLGQNVEAAAKHTPNTKLRNEASTPKNITKAMSAIALRYNNNSCHIDSVTQDANSYQESDGLYDVLNVKSSQTTTPAARAVIKKYDAFGKKDIPLFYTTEDNINKTTKLTRNSTLVMFDVDKTTGSRPKDSDFNAGASLMPINPDTHESVAPLYRDDEGRYIEAIYINTEVDASYYDPSDKKMIQKSLNGEDLCGEISYNQASKTWQLLPKDKMKPLGNWVE